MSRINSAQQPLFAIAAPIWQGLRESIGRYLPKTELLRRTVPVLIAIFASLAAIGLVTQTLQSRQSAFSLAEERLALMADLTAVRLKDEALKPDGNWQTALAASLPKGATQDERTALLADADGVRRTRDVLSFVDPDRGNVRVDVAETYDAAAQVTRGTWHLSTDSEPDFIVLPLEIRSIFPQELPLLLSLGGLRLIDRLGDWSGRSFTGAEPLQVCICESA